MRRSQQRAVVLGATGFIGHHLVRRLAEQGWQVTAVTRRTDAAHLGERTALWPSDVDMVTGDASDPGLLERLVAGAGAVFPLMGHSGAARSVQAPADDLKSNTLPHLVLLETLRVHSPLTRVVFPGSRLQYGRAHTLPVPETHPQIPTSVYGQHKATAEGYYRLYHDIHGLQTTCLRISIPYGAGQARPDRAFGVVGTFLATARRDAAIQLYGGGHQRRDFLHIDDLTDLFIACATHPKAVGRAYNASSEEPLSLRGMADIVIATVGSGRAVPVDWPLLESRIETGDYFGDIRLARDELDWQPRIRLRDGIARVCAEESAGALPALGVAESTRRR